MASSTKKILGAAALIVLVIIGFALITSSGKQPSSETQTIQAEQDKAPAFKLKNYDGNTVTLADVQAPVTIINIWASWCPFCTDELPDFATLQKQYPEKINVVAINRGEDRSTAKDFTDSVGISDDLTFLLDPSESYYRKIGGFAMPETVFLDSNQQIFRHHRGPLTLEEMKGIVDDKLTTLGESQRASDGDSFGCNGSQCQLHATNSSSTNHGN